MQQRRVAYVKFIGELYNYCMIGSSIVFDTLYTFITFLTGEILNAATPPPLPTC